MDIVEIPVSQLHFDPENARKHGKKSLEGIKASLERFGQQKPIVVDGDGKVLAGNGTLGAARALGWRTVKAVRTTLRGAEAVAYALADNKTAELSEWDEDILWQQLDALAGVEPELFEATGFTEAELERLKPTEAELGLPVEEAGESPAEKGDKHAVFPSEAEWNIPLLDLKMQAQTVVNPVRIWGTIARTNSMPGTWVFYTDDYRFTGLMSNPDQLIGSGCAVAAEMNFTIAPDTPKVCALYSVYKKRWYNRYWQSRGVRTIVDLFTTKTVLGDMDLLGVPEGWGAYSTRGEGDRQIAGIEFDYERACKRAGGDPHLFLVYGGNDAVKRLCELRGWVWVASYMENKKP